MRTSCSSCWLPAAWRTAAGDQLPRRDARAVNDDQMLIAAGVEPEAAVVRNQCSAAVIETDDPPEFFDCVYVQTETG